VLMVRTIQELATRGGKPMLGLAASCGIALVLVLAYRDDDGLGRRYQVHGRVMYRSQPLESGRITFSPIDTASPARDATGTIQVGDYTLSTIGGDDGAFPGSYRVAIVAWSAGSSEIRLIGEGSAAKHTDVMKATGRAKGLIPPKYWSPRTSPLTREVKAESNRFDFELED
jgi:hypothetical protein